MAHDHKHFTIKYCHLLQAFIRYAREECSLAVQLRRNPYQRIMRLACALPLLPREFISAGFRVVLTQAREAGVRCYNTMRPFFAYMQKNWLRNPRRRNWMCVHGFFHRTNNSRESANKMLNDAAGEDPSIYRFIGKSTDICVTWNLPRSLHEVILLCCCPHYSCFGKT